VITGRRKEVIVLGGKDIYPEEIEALYQASVFIKELCVLGVMDPDAPASERLHAIVVPDLEVLRRRKIVNVAELIRFELENVSVTLPSHKRVLGFDVAMEPLPRTTTGELNRQEVATLYRRLATRASQLVTTDAGDLDDAHLRQVIAVIQPFARPGVAVRPESNLELDLGLDSMQRVELLAVLEQQYATRVSEEKAQTAFLVSDLAEAFRGAKARDGIVVTPWETLLAGVNVMPELSVLLKPRPLTAALLFALARLLVWPLGRPHVSGLENLPSKGPFVISPNHQSYLDPVVLAGVLPFGLFRELFFVGAVEYFETRLTRWLASRLNVVPVDPDANLLPAMQAAAFGLQHGKVLMLFPEGERSIDGRVKKFKKGAAILSHHLQVPIVPVAIDGAFEIWPRNRPFWWGAVLPWNGCRVSISIGEAVRAEPSETYEAQTSRLRDAVETMWLRRHTRDGAGKDAVN